MRYLVTLWVRESPRDVLSVPITQSVEAESRLPSQAEAQARALAQEAGFVVDRAMGIVVPLPDVDASALWQRSIEFGPF